MKAVSDGTTGTAALVAGDRVAGASNGRAHTAPGALLTAREADVLELVGQALTNREIAGKLGLTEKTVKGHVTAVMKKLGVHNRVQAALIAERRHHFTPTGR